MELAAYYAEICKEPLIDRETEYDLFKELEDPVLSESKRNGIRDRIIRSNLRFCFKQAKYFSRNDPELFRELISAANEGLIVGFDKYKPSPDVRFLSYAGFWVNQRILKTMSQMRIVALPIWRQQLAARIARFMEKTESCTIEDLKTEFPDVAEKDLIELSGTKFLTFYIEDMSPDMPAFEIDPIGTDVEVRIDNERINAVVEKLPKLQADIIAMSFGLRGGQEMTHGDIAKELGISKEMLREQKKSALAALKARLANHGPDQS